ncbi:MAG: hypothetical protein WAQ25_03290 [Candidatus Saccharimonas sp.]
MHLLTNLESGGKKQKMPLALELPLETFRERTRKVGRYITRVAETPAEIQANRQFATAIFVQKGKIAPEAVGGDGVVRHDPYHSAGMMTYISTYDREQPGAPLVAAGKLFWKPGIALDHLRTPFAQTSPENQALLASLPAGSVAELGGLAKLPGTSKVATLGVLREVYRLAEEHEVQYMVAGLEPHAWPAYRQLFANGIELMHNPTEAMMRYPGIIGDQVGIRMNIPQAYQLYRESAIRGRLGERASRLAVIEHFSNRVNSFQSVFHRS